LARSDGPSNGYAFGEITSGRTDIREAADAEARGVRPLAPVINAATTDRSSPAQVPLAAAAEAQAQAEAGARRSRRSSAPTRIESDDLYDHANGLYLVLTPRLGIARATAAESTGPGPADFAEAGDNTSASAAGPG